MTDRDPFAVRARRAMFLAAAFVAAAIAVTWPLVRHLDGSLPVEPRDPLLSAWILAWDADRAAHLFRGIWNAPILYPYRETLAFSEHLFGIAWMTIPMQWLTGNPILSQNCAFLMSYVIAGAGMYLLVLEITGRRDAALLAGLLFEMCPYRYAQLARIQIEFMGWLPIGLWAMHRYARRGEPRWAAVATAAFCLLGLSNGYYLYFLLLPAATVGVWMLRAASVPVRRVAIHAAIAGAVVAAIFAPIARVYVDARERYDLRRDVSDNARFSADVGSYLHVTPAIREHFTPAAWLPDFIKPAGPLETKEGELFPGFVALAFAVVAIWADGGSRARVLATPAASSADRPPAVRASGVGTRAAVLWMWGAPVALVALVTILIAADTGALLVSVALWLLLLRVFVPFPRTLAGVYAAIAIVALVLSLGPLPTAWGRMFWLHGPYDALFRLVPGLDGLRVPARIGMVVSLALCVLAGIGAARVLSSRGFVARTVIVAVSVLVAFADTFGGGIPLAAIGRHGRLAERIVYEWIARQPPGAVLELPIGPLDYDYRAFRYQYATLVHGHPLVNGWTGYSTPLQQWLGSTVSPLRDPDDADDAIRFLQGLGVGYVVFHPDDFADGDAAAHLQRMLTTRTDVFRRGEQWGSIVAYALAAPAVDDPPPAATTPIPIASITASQRTEAAGALLDGRIDTLWTTAKPQSGDEWLRVTLAARATPTEAALRVNPAVFNDYPRRLVVDAESSGSSTTVFSGAVAGAFGAAFRRAPEDLWIRIPLRPAVADALRLRQTGHAPWWWSVAGLQVRR